jgi:hypothetical protein
MESRRTESNRDVIDQHREVIPPAVSQERLARAAEVYETEPEGVPPVGPRVRWSGVMSGGYLCSGDRAVADRLRASHWHHRRG